MYVVTFYSYKGGVGRTMALVNTAAALAAKGKCVLVVDFDLEAPSLPSYGVFSCADGQLGIVDYVTDYIKNDTAPDIRQYVYKADSQNLWIMPAGDYRSGSYSHRLSSIDWQDLYDNHDGYLMFEDMKQQWAEFNQAGFDYVLVDSRTGHTDVGGICTRQLPNAVVVMFLPNEQNIGGLEPIVSGIRGEHDGTSGREIVLHFCPSNVPDLDDEEHILGSLIDQSKAKLGYVKPAATLHHYSSLQILVQIPFIVSRPKSRLSKEYEELATSIISSNYEDKEGAAIALRKIKTEYRKAREEGERGLKIEELTSTTEKIWKYHSPDPEIAYLLAQVYDVMGSPQDELVALTVAIEGGYKMNEARLSRAATYMQMNEPSRAAEDLKAVLNSDLTTTMLGLPAIEMLRSANRDDWLEAVNNAPFLHKLTPNEAYVVSATLFVDREALPAALKLFRLALSGKRISDDERIQMQAQEVLCLIGMGHFGEARILLFESRKKALKASQIADVFNYAMAEWGEVGTPPMDMFQRVIDLADDEFLQKADANSLQCLALAYHVVGGNEAAMAKLHAAREAAKARGREFSCWRYLEVSPGEMLKDLLEMERAINHQSALTPVVFTDTHTTRH